MKSNITICPNLSGTGLGPQRGATPRIDGPWKDCCGLSATKQKGCKYGVNLGRSSWASFQTYKEKSRHISCNSKNYATLQILNKTSRNLGIHIHNYSKAGYHVKDYSIIPYHHLP
jgi:hypothetical protein